MDRLEERLYAEQKSVRTKDRGINPLLQPVSSRHGQESLLRLGLNGYGLAVFIQSMGVLPLKTKPLKGGTRCPHRVLSRTLSSQPVGDNGLHLGLRDTA